MISFFYENYRRVEILHYVSVSQMTITTYFVPHSWFIIGVVTWVTRQMPLAEQELLTLPEYLGSFPVCSRACFALSWVFCVVYCRSLLGLFIFFFYFDHCVVRSSSIYGFWLPLWYLQTYYYFIFFISEVEEFRIMTGRGRNGDEPYDTDTFGTYSVGTLWKWGSFLSGWYQSFEKQNGRDKIFIIKECFELKAIHKGKRNHTKNLAQHENI
jgi:hypothetical protein